MNISVIFIHLWKTNWTFYYSWTNTWLEIEKKVLIHNVTLPTLTFLLEYGTSLLLRFYIKSQVNAKGSKFLIWSLWKLIWKNNCKFLNDLHWSILLCKKKTSLSFVTSIFVTKGLFISQTRRDRKRDGTIFIQSSTKKLVNFQLENQNKKISPWTKFGR